MIAKLQVARKEHYQVESGKIGTLLICKMQDRMIAKLQVQDSNIAKLWVAR